MANFIKQKIEGTFSLFPVYRKDSKKGDVPAFYSVGVSTKNKEGGFISASLLASFKKADDINKWSPTQSRYLIHIKEAWFKVIPAKDQREQRNTVGLFINDYEIEPIVEEKESKNDLPF